MEKFHPNHQHYPATVTMRNPPSSKEAVNDWLLSVVAAVEMHVLFGPFVKQCDDPGNEGITGIVGLSESHSSFHCWNMKQVPYLQFDVYSCKEFSPDVIRPMFAVFDPIEIDDK